MIAVDVTVDDEQPVVYLSHEGDDTVHGFWLGCDYETTLTACSSGLRRRGRLAVGAIRLRSAVMLGNRRRNAKLWREWFGLRVAP